MTDLSISEESWGNVDRSCLASTKGMHTGKNATLDGDSFQAAIFDDGVPAYTLLVRQANGLVGPYTPGDPVLGVVANLHGFLINPVDDDPAAGARYVGAAQWEGAFYRQRLPFFGEAAGTPGRLDAAAEAALRHIEFRDL